MSVDSLDEARIQLDHLLARLEAVIALLELSDKLYDPRYAPTRAKAMQAIMDAEDAAQIMNRALGAAPAPLKH